MTAWILATTCLGLATANPSRIGAQLIAEGRIWMPGNGTDDRDGSALVAGDFNGDGYDDLVIGTPEDDAGSLMDVGRVRVLFGGAGGFGQVASFRETIFAGGTSEDGDRFGAALAAADFDLDGFDDLVVGIPGKSTSGAQNSGKVVVIYGEASGLDLNRFTFFDEPTLLGTAEPGDQFGAVLAAGPLGLESHPDLVIGIPGQEINGSSNAGAVLAVFSESDSGVQAGGQVGLHQNVPGVLGIASTDDRFGSALAIGDVTGDGRGDLIVGVPGDLVGPELGAGAVQMIPGGLGGVSISEDQELWNQDVESLLGDAASGDEFGAAVSLGDFNDDGFLDLAIGVPGESQFGPEESGAVQVLYGTDSGLATSGDQVLLESLVSPEVAAFDRFGTALSAGDFNADGRDDLAIGMPLDNVFGMVNAGNVPVIYGGSAGLEVAGAQLWNGFFLLTVEPGDELGFALASGHFTGRAAADLAIGVPGRASEGGFVQAGGTLVVRSQSLFSDGFETSDASRWSLTQP